MTSCHNTVSDVTPPAHGGCAPRLPLYINTQHCSTNPRERHTLFLSLLIYIDAHAAHTTLRNTSVLLKSTAAALALALGCRPSCPVAALICDTLNRLPACVLHSHTWPRSQGNTQLLECFCLSRRIRSNLETLYPCHCLAHTPTCMHCKHLLLAMHTRSPVTTRQPDQTTTHSQHAHPDASNNSPVSRPPGTHPPRKRCLSQALQH
jgi:hypothetical protein